MAPGLGSQERAGQRLETSGQSNRRSLPGPGLVLREGVQEPGGGGLRAVSPQVVLEGLLVAEAAPALGALVGPLPGVDPLVLEQVLLADEALAADGALEGPLPRVQALVVLEVLLAAVALAALLALVGPLAPVGHLVPHQPRVAVEALPAFGALVGALLTVVAALVHLEALLHPEHLAALAAAVRPVGRALRHKGALQLAA